MNVRILLGVVSMVAVAGCSAESEPSIGGGEDDLTTMRSALDRQLSPGIAVPTGTPIGGSLEGVVSQKAQGRTASAPAKAGACTVTRYSASGGTTMSYEKCPDSAYLRFYATANMPVIVYADHDGDGKVDAFRDETGPLYELNDDNHDGKVDRIIEAAERAGEIDIEAFGEGWTVSNGGRIANRIREDKNHDGTFEVESITAKTPEMFVI